MAKMQMSAVRRKQVMLLVALVVVIGVIAFVASTLSAPPARAPAPPSQEVRKRFSTPGGSIDPQSEWRTQEGAKVEQLSSQLDDIRKQMDAARATQDHKDAEAAAATREREAAARAAAFPAGPLPPQGAPRTAAGLGPVPGEAPLAPPKPAGILVVELAKEPGALAPPGAATHVRVAATVRAAGQGAGAGAASLSGYLPAGTWFQLVTMSGADAPTGGQNQSNPVPMLFRVTGVANLPNGAKVDLTDCMVTANGYGDISSERTIVRLDRLGCTTREGAAIDTAIKGYVSDESGKMGMRGRLVTKQGQVLANALLAGVVSGLSSAFVQSSSIVSTNPLGSTSTIESGKEYQAGLAQGVKQGADRLSQYYLALADKLYPVIETDAARPVDAVLTQGLNLTSDTTP
jgi:conjugal transfer pilus assembly protein TraB